MMMTTSRLMNRRLRPLALMHPVSGCAVTGMVQG
jgi:hypothetical protein